MKKKISTKELIWYIISAIIGVCGLGLLVTGIVGTYLPGLESENVISKAESSFASWLKVDISFKALGIILIAVAAIVAMIVLVYYAKKYDVEQERAQKRAQRLGSTLPTND